MADMLSNIGLVVTQIVTWVGNVATMITTTPILLLPICFLSIGGAVGIFGRLLSRN